MRNTPLYPSNSEIERKLQSEMRKREERLRDERILLQKTQEKLKRDAEILAQLKVIKKRLS